jgi:hypothetical protein
VLLGGLALYTVASVFGAAAPSIEALVVWRRCKAPRWPRPSPAADRSCAISTSPAKARA